jgi:hypothetical protein
MFYQDFELSRQRAVDMRTEVGRNRLEARLHKGARQAKGSLLEEISPPRGLFARSAAFAAALFR